MLKIVITISLLFVCSIAYAQPLYTKSVSNFYVIDEDGKMSNTEITKIFKDGEYKGSKNKPILKEEEFNEKGAALLNLISTKDFGDAVKQEHAILGVGNEETVTFQTEILQDGQIQVRAAIRTFENGEEIAKTFHRHVLAPDTSTETLNKEVQRVQDIADAVWTNEVIENYNTKKAKREKELSK